LDDVGRQDEGASSLGSMTSRAAKPSRQTRLHRLVLAVVVLPVLFSSCSESQTARPISLLVVGDSVSAQAAEAMIHLAPAGTTVRVDAVQPGTAPCDWDYGFTDPTDDESHDFASILRQVRPAAVAFVFTGNPGLDGPKGGCVDANSPYSLSQLLASYEPPLIDMANQAVRTGATVYFEAPPPRNPAVPVGYDAQRQTNQGFQGSPADGNVTVEGTLFASNATFEKNVTVTGGHIQFDNQASTVKGNLTVTGSDSSDTNGFWVATTVEKNLNYSGNAAAPFVYGKALTVVGQTNIS
jgi:hypothetical protein